MNIDKLYSTIYDNNIVESAEKFIKLFEDNKNLIEEQDIDKDRSTYNAVMRITADYSFQLVSKENYTKALPNLNKSIKLFEGFDGFANSEGIHDIDYYIRLRFERGITNYYLKKYSEAEEDFNWLLKYYPENERYKNWHSSIKYLKYDNLIKILWYVIFGSILISSLLDKHAILRVTILIIGIIGLIAAGILEALKRYYKKKSA